MASPFVVPASRRVISAPALDSERLTLRAYRLEDFDDTHAMWADPAVLRFLRKPPLSREESWTRFLRDLGHWATLGYGCWCVRDRASGRYVGEVGVFDRHRALAGEYAERFSSAPEAGWVLAPWSYGRGLATEAMTAVLAWVDRGLGAPRTVCMIDGSNVASHGVARKLGFSPLGAARYGSDAVNLFERLADG